MPPFSILFLSSQEVRYVHLFYLYIQWDMPCYSISTGNDKCHPILSLLEMRYAILFYLYWKWDIPSYSISTGNEISHPILSLYLVIYATMFYLYTKWCIPSCSNSLYYKSHYCESFHGHYMIHHHDGQNGELQSGAIGGMNINISVHNDSILHCYILCQTYCLLKHYPLCKISASINIFSVKHLFSDILFTV